MMSGSVIRTTYNRFVASLIRKGSPDALQTAVGGEFDAIGHLERQLLIQYGLGKGDYLIDVGCGSGRLAKPLSTYLIGNYLGIDVVPELVEHARTLVARPHWRFETTDGFGIPERDARADMVCFFSVFTHLLHEHSYTYLTEARRVLKPGRRIVFSFLEFRIASHWSIFANRVGDLGENRPLDMFVSRDGIAAWAAHLDLEVEAVHDGDQPHIVLPDPVTFDDGRVQSGLGTLGQSVCVLRKRS
jgi:SAM-dependent methyltransferase